MRGDLKHHHATGPEETVCDLPAVVPPRHARIGTESQANPVPGSGNFQTSATGPPLPSAEPDVRLSSMSGGSGA